MSISGTGTQADPYVVDTWADFVTAIGTADAYVVVNTSIINTWDFAKTVEGGITTTINWNAVEVDGNGLTIKGLYGTAARWFTKTSQNYTGIIKNLNLIDMVTTATTTGVFHLRAMEFRNCKFSGIIENSNFIEQYSGGNATFTTGSINDNDPRGCSFAFKFSGSARLTSSTNCVFNHCNMSFDGTSTSTTAQQMKMYESKISGAMPWTSFTNAGGGQNVIDADIETIGTWTNSSGGVTLVNTDKLATGLTVPTGFTGATTAQMLDVDALAELGFTAFPEEEPEPEEPEEPEETEGGEGE